MGKIKENGEARQRRPAFWLGLFSLALLAAFGCSTTNKSKGDPLMGEFPKGEPAKSPPTKTSSNQVPPIPTATSDINNSNLAAGTLPGSRNLAIGQPQNNPANNPGALTAGDKGKTNTVLANPTPVVEPVPRDNTTVVPASNWDKGKQAPAPDPLLTQPSTTANTTPTQPPRQGLTWPDVNWAANPPPQPAAVTPPPPGQAPIDPLQAQLKSKGVTWQRAENVAGGVKFTCIMPNPQNPQTSRAYEAIGPDYPAAVRAVLWEIDNRK